MRATFRDVKSSALELVMSRSSPGRYALHEFAKNIYGIRASDGSGQALPVTHLDPYSWKVPRGRDGTVVFEYTVFGDHADGTYNGIDQTHAHLNMPATLIWARGMTDQPATMYLETAGRDWTVATQMVPTVDGGWSAPNLEWLMDCPVEVSKHTLLDWSVGGARFRLSLHHQGTSQEAEHFARHCEQVVREEEGVFGAFPNYDGGAYTFLIDYLPTVYPDGMEHRDSTFITDRRALATSEKSLLGAVSHEFFHSWNVKRIRPASLEPFDFERADMSGELWFAEGFTNYYGELTLMRASLQTLEEFSESMSSAINRVLRAPGRLEHSATEMSELAPFVDAATSIDGTNFHNTYISYYTYGQALALGIDLMIRRDFPGKSLDDWMRLAWKRHPEIERPYTSEDLETELGEATGDRKFAADVFQRFIRGREPMSYGELLPLAGMTLRKAKARVAWLGSTTWVQDGDGLRSTSQAIRGTPLYEAGFETGDVLISIDRKKVRTSEQVETELAKRKPGDQLSLQIKTRDGERTVTVRLAEDPELELVADERAGKPVSKAAESFRRSWLSSKAIHPNAAAK